MTQQAEGPVAGRLQQAAGNRFRGGEDEEDQRLGAAGAVARAVDRRIRAALLWRRRPNS